MSSIKKRRGKYYARVQWRDRSNRMKEKLIPLKTGFKSEAVVRNHEVETVEDLIKNGEEWSFPWFEEDGKLVRLQMTLSDAIEDFYSVKRLDNLRPRTFEAYEQGLGAFMKVIGYDYPIEQISHTEIDQFKAWSRKRHAPATTNLCLQKIKSFMIYCAEKQYIERHVSVDMIKVKEKPPMYLSDQKLEQLFMSDLVDEHFRKAFAFYVSTGCRLEEPFNGFVRGNWLIIDPESSKSGIEREILLTENTLPILLEMRASVDNNTGRGGYGSKGASRRWLIKAYSRQFKKVAVAEGFGEHKFHNLSDTYATRRWAVTGDLLAVSREIGHTSVKMTEKYTKFKLRRLIDDFPSIADQIERRLSYSSLDTGLDCFAMKSLPKDSRIA